MGKATEGAPPKAGDVLVVSGDRLGQSDRTGEILEVLGEHGREHFRVRWDDGHESVFFPSSDTSVRRHRPAAARRTSEAD